MRRRRKLGSLLQRVLLVCALLAVVVPIAVVASVDRQPPAPPHRPILGVYPGYAPDGEIAGVLGRFEQETRTRVRYGHDFIDHRYGWRQIEGDDARLDAWVSWVSGSDDRRFTLSLPLLPGSNDGSERPWTHPDAYNFSGLADGSLVPHFEALARRLQARPELRDTIIRLGWEFNGNSWPWSPSEAGTGDTATNVHLWKDGWSRVAAAMTAIAPDLEFEWCLAIGYDALPGWDLEELYPGDAAVDYIGVGAYDYSLEQTGLSDEERWERAVSRPNGLDDVAALAEERGKPLARTEWGLWPARGYAGQEGGGDSPYYMEKTAEWFDEHRVAYSVYNNTGPHALAQYPRSLRRYGELFG